MLFILDFPHKNRVSLSFRLFIRLFIGLVISLNALSAQAAPACFAVFNSTEKTKNSGQIQDVLKLILGTMNSAEQKEISEWAQRIASSEKETSKYGLFDKTSSLKTLSLVHPLRLGLVKNKDLIISANHRNVPQTTAEFLLKWKARDLTDSESKISSALELFDLIGTAHLRRVHDWGLKSFDPRDHAQYLEFTHFLNRYVEQRKNLLEALQAQLKINYNANTAQKSNLKKMTSRIQASIKFLITYDEYLFSQIKTLESGNNLQRSWLKLNMSLQKTSVILNHVSSFALLVAAAQIYSFSQDEKEKFENLIPKLQGKDFELFEMSDSEIHKKQTRLLENLKKSDLNQVELEFVAELERTQ